MLMTKDFLTTVGASATQAGVAIVKTGLPTVGKCALIIQPDRSGDIRLQHSSGILSDGKYLLIPQSSGGSDPLVVYFDSMANLPTHIASNSSTPVTITYTVAITR